MCGPQMFPQDKTHLFSVLQSCKHGLGHRENEPLRVCLVYSLCYQVCSHRLSGDNLTNGRGTECKLYIQLLSRLYTLLRMVYTYPMTHSKMILLKVTKVQINTARTMASNKVSCYQGTKLKLVIPMSNTFDNYKSKLRLFSGPSNERRDTQFP